MGQPQNSKAASTGNRLYRAAKVSEYRFKRVLWSFVIDEPVADAAQRTGLSANSVQAIYARLRVFFTDVGLFLDIYAGGDPRDGSPEGEDMEGFEYRLIPFHFKRMKAKRRVRETQVTEIDYHWNESFWRFHFSILQTARPTQTEAIHRMMYAHLLAMIRLCGPVGAKPRNRRKALQLQIQQLDQRALWLARNAPEFSDEQSRAQLNELRG